MSSKLHLISVVILVCSLAMSSDNCLYNPPGPCDNLPCNPCSDDYWQQMRNNQCYKYISSGNPLQVFGNGEPVLPYTSPPEDRLFKSGPLLLHGKSTTTKDGQEELVFLKGAGEYYEITALPHIPNDKITDLFAMLHRNGINLVRLFTYSGDITRVQDGWTYPFTWHPETDQFALRQYNTEFFNRLEHFLDAAENSYSHDYIPRPGDSPIPIKKNHKIYINLCLFDFSDDLNIQWDRSAWNCINNDHGIHSPQDWKEMYHIFQDDGSLNSLGRVQRDFVLKVVRSTRHHANIYYEIQNVPKLGEPENVARWADQVNQWIKRGLDDCDCDGAAHHLTGMTQSSMDEVTMELMKLPDIDFFGRHDACKGMFDRQPNMDAETSCEDRATMHLSLEMESAQFNSDFYLPYIPGEPLTILADTDGLHRMIGGHELAPYGRDFDLNCRYWTHIAFAHGGVFNTKETLHFHENPDELDCLYVDPDDAQYCNYRYGQRLMQPVSCGNCDDFVWEHEDFGDGNRFCGFDTGVAAAMNDLPLTRRPFVRIAGYGPVPTEPGGEMTLYVTNGNVYGNATGDAIATHLAYVMPGQTGYSPEIPWLNMVYVDTLPGSGGNILEYSIPVTEEWVSYEPFLFSLIGSTVDGTVSDPWPFLISHRDTVVPSTRGKEKARDRIVSDKKCIGKTVIDTVGRSDRVRSVPLSLPGGVKGRWTQELKEYRVQQVEKGRPISNQPRVCAAGWNYSTLMDSFSTGLMQIAVVVYVPGPPSPPELFLRLADGNDGAGSGEWTGLGAIEHWTVTTEEDGTYYSTILFYDLHADDPSRYFPAGAYLLELKAEVGGVVSGVWPYFEL